MPYSPFGINEDTLAPTLTNTLVLAPEKKHRWRRAENGSGHKGHTIYGLRDRFWFRWHSGHFKSWTNINYWSEKYQVKISKILRNNVYEIYGGTVNSLLMYNL